MVDEQNKSNDDQLELKFKIKDLEDKIRDLTHQLDISERLQKQTRESDKELQDTKSKYEESKWKERFMWLTVIFSIILIAMAIYQFVLKG